MISVILCGGVGARLWPVSRELYPKPFMRLKDGLSFIQKAFLRGAAVGAENMLTITNRDLFFKIAEEYETLALPLPARYILEPFGMNTGPAIAAATLFTAREWGDDELMLVLPSDHLVALPEKFAHSVDAAKKMAIRGQLATFGIVPTEAKTNFGYIEVDGEKAKRFVEKPVREKAEEYVASRRFLWNSGMFCFRAGVMLDELARTAPDLLEAVKKCVDASPIARGDDPNSAQAMELEQELFRSVPSISIDCAVFEKSNNIAVVHGDFGWSDVGSWTELCNLDLGAPDRHGNRIAEPANAVLHETCNCDVNNNGRLVATLGVDGLLIVDTEDALLIADKSRDQEVKAIFDRLKRMNHETFSHHRTIHRPWGSFTLLETGLRFKIKRLVLKPGAQISLQRHYNRSEHWIVVSGMAEVTCDDKVTLVNSNESTYIKAGSRHRVANPGKVELALIEVQIGDYLGEDDIVRYDDAYGRV